MKAATLHPGIAVGESRHTVSALLPSIYEELRRFAARKMAIEAPGQTLQPTALAHEAWLRLAGDDQAQWHNRTHFLAAAAEAMRHILIDKARHKHRLRHGQGRCQVNLEDVDLASTAAESMKEREATIPEAGKPRLLEALQRLVQIFDSTRRPDQASGWKKKLEDFERTQANRAKLSASPKPGNNPLLRSDTPIFHHSSGSSLGGIMRSPISKDVSL